MFVATHVLNKLDTSTIRFYRI